MAKSIYFYISSPQPSPSGEGLKALPCWGGLGEEKYNNSLLQNALEFDFPPPYKPKLQRYYELAQVAK
jgi:hypothetical protein